MQMSCGNKYHLTLLAIVVIGMALVGSGHVAAGAAARFVEGTATAHLHLVKADGAQLDEEGPVSGALPGSMSAVLYTGNTLTGSFTIHTRQGTIDGSGRAASHGTGRYRSFAGTLTITGGSGLYRHAQGRAGLYGTFDRRTYALVIQTTGRFSY